MFAYCRNNPVGRVDPAGLIDTVCRTHTDGKNDRYYHNWLLDLDITYTKYPLGDWDTLFGVGIQLDYSGEYGVVAGSVGIEVILFFGTEGAKSSDSGVEIAAYFYLGPGVSSNTVLKGLDEAKTVAELLLKYQDLLKIDGANAIEAITKNLKFSGSFSISGLLVYGNSDFKTSKDYRRWFNSWSANVIGLKGSYSWSDCCTVYGIGRSFGGGWGVSRSTSYYVLLNNLFG